MVTISNSNNNKEAKPASVRPEFKPKRLSNSQMYVYMHLVLAVMLIFLAFLLFVLYNLILLLISGSYLKSMIGLPICFAFFVYWRQGFDTVKYNIKDIQAGYVELD